MQLVRQRLTKRGFWHPSNQLLQICGLSLLQMVPLVLMFGLWIVPLIAPHHFVSVLFVR